jgi:hypothetical protein
MYPPNTSFGLSQRKTETRKYYTHYYEKIIHRPHTTSPLLTNDSAPPHPQFKAYDDPAHNIPQRKFGWSSKLADNIVC